MRIITLNALNLDSSEYQTYLDILLAQRVCKTLWIPNSIVQYADDIQNRNDSPTGKVCCSALHMNAAVSANCSYECWMSISYSLHHLNTENVRYSDSHCTVLVRYPLCTCTWHKGQTAKQTCREMHTEPRWNRMESLPKVCPRNKDLERNKTGYDLFQDGS